MREGGFLEICTGSCDIVQARQDVDAFKARGKDEKHQKKQ